MASVLGSGTAVVSSVAEQHIVEDRAEIVAAGGLEANVSRS